MDLCRVSFVSIICALSLGLAGCDGRVAFPGFDDKPDDKKEVPPPPGGDVLPPPQLPTTDPIIPSEPGPTTPVAPVPIDPETGSDTPAPDDPFVADTPETGDVIDVSDNTPGTEPATDEPTETPAPDTPLGPVEEPTPEPPAQPVEPAFSYHAPGDLTPGSGQGSPDRTVYAPDMVFPIEKARTFPQTMVFQPGGFRYEGDLPGDECIPQNYEYPWRDNFCERGRPASFKSASCPAGSGVHLGQDIRVGDGPTCEAMRRKYRTNTQSITDYKVVAAEDGMISNISSYTVTLRAGPRTYRYLHMNMRALQVSIGDEVTAGRHLGYVSKDFGFDSNGNRRPTTFHLHFVLKINTDEGSVFVPPYTSLVESYARREGAPGREIERNIAIASDALNYDPTEVFESIE